MTTRLPVFRPRLPDADRLLPYLRRIDSARVYTNWGPLATELELRLAALFVLPDLGVVSAASGTAALVGAILASAGRARTDRPLACVPAFTFVATAIAVEQCGYRPYVVDVDPDTWRLDLDRLTQHDRLNEVGLVVAAAPFGRPVAQQPALAFQNRTGVPVVIDGGASFEAMARQPVEYAGPVPTALSFHATKSFSTAEGGCVITTDTRLVRRIAQALNFGFHGARDSVVASTNGKMSEYHAAIGLAELDDWPAKRDALHAVANKYRTGFRSFDRGRFVGAPDVAGCYALFEADSRADSERVQDSLLQSGIESRLWYGSGLLGHEHFRSLAHDSFEVARRLAAVTIGLPVASDLSDTAAEGVVDAIRRSLLSAPPVV